MKKSKEVTNLYHPDQVLITISYLEGILEAYKKSNKNKREEATFKGWMNTLEYIIKVHNMNKK